MGTQERGGSRSHPSHSAYHLRHARKFVVVLSDAMSTALPEQIDVVETQNPAARAIGIPLEETKAVGVPLEEESKHPSEVYCKDAKPQQLDRIRLCSDISNIATVAALVGGFALGNLSGGKVGDDFGDVMVYMCNVVAVHACTCSCLMSAMLYCKANGLPEEGVTMWAQENGWLLGMPFMKLGMGCVFYLVSVIFLSFRDLESHGWARYAALIIGVMSVVSVFMTAGYIFTSKRQNSFFKLKES